MGYVVGFLGVSLGLVARPSFVSNISCCPSNYGVGGTNVHGVWVMGSRVGEELGI